LKKKGRNNRKKSQGAGRYIAPAFLVLVAIAACVYFASNFVGQKKSEEQKQQSRILAGASVKPVHPPISSTFGEYTAYAPEEKIPLPEKAVPPVNITATGRAKGVLSIIVDDMGSSMTEAKELASIGLPLTFSIIPGLPHSSDVAAFALSRGIEYMIHIPMQSKGWPERRLEENGLLVSMDEEEIKSRMADYYRLLPGASGANNHMGSEFTEHEEKMRPVLSFLKEKGLFFIDSVTTPGTAGYRLAREMGIRSGRRAVFLDNEQKRDYIAGQLKEAVMTAGKKGYAIAICHPHPATISALAEILPRISSDGVRLLPVSVLLGSF